MAFPSSFSFFLKTSFLTLAILSTLFFFLLKPPSPPSPPHQTRHRSLLPAAATSTGCSSVDETHSSNGLINYFSLHFCLFNQNPFLSISFLTSLSILFFYILIRTAQSHFSLVTTKLSTLLNLSPSMAAVTLLALGNGSPDIFSSVVALRNGEYRTGFGAILSAGAFVSALVVGFVAIYAAPFSVDAGCFVRDVGFYLVAAMFLFYVYLSGEIFLWQAVGFVGFYAFFVGIVFWMDLGMNRSEKKGEMEMSLVGPDCEIGGEVKVLERKRGERFGFSHFYGMVSKVWEQPVTTILKLTIPETSPSEWNRYYSSANIALCPILLLYACDSFMAFNHPVSFLLPNTHLPLWFVVLLASSSLALLHFLVEKEPPKTEQMHVVIIAFIMSVFWISTTAGELLNCLATIGTILELPSAILGLTVLAWGNSVGDLVADVAVARAGHPTMAMAGCFAGPMFNMLVGLGTALVIQTANVYPKAYRLHFHMGIIVAFVFLLISLMGSLLVITWSRFRVPKFWGFCLVGLYVIFTAVSLVIAMFFG